MEEGKSNALVPFSISGNGIAETGPRSIVASMVTDALARAQSQTKAHAAARFRIGEYEFCDPDYRQILIWARALGNEPERIVSILSKSAICIFHEDENGRDLPLIVEDGSIKALAWNFEELPIPKFEWVDGLLIQEIAFEGKSTASIAPRLPMLKQLSCVGIELSTLDLSSMPSLASLDCSDNQLSALNIGTVPMLQGLWCSNNMLSDLDLTRNPALTHLVCHTNNISSLDLKRVPNLSDLACGENLLTELDLSNVPRIRNLWCPDNRLTRIDLSRAPVLESLNCGNNNIVELNIFNVPKLTRLICHGNQLAALPLSQAPALQQVWTDCNQISELDLRALKKLKYIKCDPFVNLAQLSTQNFTNA